MKKSGYKAIVGEEEDGLFRCSLSWSIFCPGRALDLSKMGRTLLWEIRVLETSHKVKHGKYLIEV